MIGFETIGNATLTVFDNKPVLSTDPWIEGKPYFGSWGHAYSIPEDQINNIKASKYIWLSHGHPDHIDPDSLKLFEKKTFLIADHYGDRIFNDLSKSFDCIKLKNRKYSVENLFLRMRKLVPGYQCLQPPFFQYFWVQVHQPAHEF